MAVEAILRKILGLRRVDVDDWWTGFLLAVPGIAGSLASFLYFGAGLWAVFSIVIRRYPICVPKQARPFVAASLGYAFVLLLSSIANDGAAGILPGLTAGAPLYFIPLLISRFVSSSARRAFETMCIYAPVGAILCLMPALMQAFVLNRAVEGGAGNGAVFGFVSAILAAISLTNANSGVLPVRILAWGGFLAGAGAIILSQSRSLYPVIILMPALCLHFLPRVEMRASKRPAVAVAVLIVIGGMLLWGRISRDVLFSADELSRIGGDPYSGSFGMRLELWKSAFRAIWEAPWIGHGQLHKMDMVISRVPEFMSYVEFSHAHNVWIDSAVGGGLPAALFVTFIFLSPFYLLKRSTARHVDPRVKYLISAMFLITVLNGLVNTLFTHDILSVIYLVPMIIMLSRDDETPV